MFNTLLWIGWVLLSLTALLFAFKKFGKMGVIGVMTGSIVMTNILVIKSVFLFGLGATAGNVLYAIIFLATDMLSEHYGGKEARKAVMLGFFVSVFMTISAWIAMAMIPAPWDFAQASFTVIFTPMARIVLGSMIAYLISNTLDTYSYDFLKKRFPKHLWLRNNGSTWTSQLVDSIIFMSIALLGVIPFTAWLQVLIGNYVLKVIIAAMDTPFLYLSKRYVKK
jgi:uncharacterized integral membrane protein (TIGR00697 family)